MVNEKKTKIGVPEYNVVSKLMLLQYVHDYYIKTTTVALVN